MERKSWIWGKMMYGKIQLFDSMPPPESHCSREAIGTAARALAGCCFCLLCRAMLCCACEQQRDWPLQR